MSTDIGGAPDAEFFLSGPCPTCRFAPEEVTTLEAITALRSFPERWRTVLALHLDDPAPEALPAERPNPTSWSALEHAGHVRDVVHALDIRLQRVLREDEPVLPETHVTPPAGANEQGMAVVLAALGVSTDQFAQTIAKVPPQSWNRRARRAGAAVTALDLVREATHEGIHHLRLATETLAELRAAAAPA